jgi:hypothetical protein
MKKLLIIGAAGAGAAFLAKRFASASNGVDFGQLIERLPEDSPPKWMFSNITAIRESTERIRDNTERTLELLEKQQPSSGPRRHGGLPGGF